MPWAATRAPVRGRVQAHIRWLEQELADLDDEQSPLPIGIWATVRAPASPADGHDDWVQIDRAGRPEIVNL